MWLGDLLTGPNRRYAQSARRLFTTSMFPLTSPTYMLLRWQRAELEDVALSDSDDDSGAVGPALYTVHDGDGVPSSRYTTHEDYKR